MTVKQTEVIGAHSCSSSTTPLTARTILDWAQKVVLGCVSADGSVDHSDTESRPVTYSPPKPDTRVHLPCGNETERSTTEAGALELAIDTVADGNRCQDVDDVGDEELRLVRCFPEEMNLFVRSLREEVFTIKVDTMETIPEEGTPGQTFIGNDKDFLHLKPSSHVSNANDTARLRATDRRRRKSRRARRRRMRLSKQPRPSLAPVGYLLLLDRESFEASFPRQ